MPSLPPVNNAPRSSLSLISIANLASFCTEGAKHFKEGNWQREQSFSTTSESGSHLIRMMENSVVTLDAAATANLMCFRWLIRHNTMPGRVGLRRESTYPAQVRFKFGDGRMGDVRHAADITAGAAGAKGNFTAFVLDAGSPALLRKGA